MQQASNLQTVLNGLIDSVPGLVMSMSIMFGVVGLALAAFAGTQIYRAVQDGEGTPTGWLIAFGAACMLTIVGVVTGQASFLFVG